MDDITERNTPSYVPVVANTEKASTIAFIAPGPTTEHNRTQPDVMYVSASWSQIGQPIWRERVPAFSSRNLDDFELAYKDNFRSTQIKVQSFLYMLLLIWTVLRMLDLIPQ